MTIEEFLSNNYKYNDDSREDAQSFFVYIFTLCCLCHFCFFKCRIILYTSFFGHFKKLAQPVIKTGFCNRGSVQGGKLRNTHFRVFNSQPCSLRQLFRQRIKAHSGIQLGYRGNLHP